MLCLISVYHRWKLQRGYNLRQNTWSFYFERFSYKWATSAALILLNSISVSEVQYFSAADTMNGNITVNALIKSVRGLINIMIQLMMVTYLPRPGEESRQRGIYVDIYKKRIDSFIILIRCNCIADKVWLIFIISLSFLGVIAHAFHMLYNFNC